MSRRRNAKPHREGCRGQVAHAVEVGLEAGRHGLARASDAHLGDAVDEGGGVRREQRDALRGRLGREQRHEGEAELVAQAEELLALLRRQVDDDEAVDAALDAGCHEFARAEG
eukprot:scaffold3438_cov62-Phaeocystis_antarctica.AAC.4